jgi:hypothetical protein
MEAFMSASHQALAAVRAAKNAKRWGDFAAMRFAQRNFVPARMYVRALVTEQKLAEKRAGEEVVSCPF